MGVKRYDTFQGSLDDGQSVMVDSEDGFYVFHSDYQKCDELVRELVEALEQAELALINCVPVVPYRGDGPLVGIRKTLAKAKAIDAGEETI